MRVSPSGMAPASQAGSGEFDSRHPLHIIQSSRDQMVTAVFAWSGQWKKDSLAGPGQNSSRAQEHRAFHTERAMEAGILSAGQGKNISRTQEHTALQSPHEAPEEHKYIGPFRVRAGGLQGHKYIGTFTWSDPSRALQSAKKG